MVDEGGEPGGRGEGCCTGRDSKRRSPSVSLTKFPTARDTEGSTFLPAKGIFFERFAAICIHALSLSVYLLSC